MIILISCLLILIHCDCIPYGMRLSLGHYYSHLNDIGNYITLTFNSQNLCLDFIVQITDQTSLNNIPVINYQLLNMTKVYEGTEQTLTYETYIYTIKFGQFNGIQPNHQYNYSIFWENNIISGPHYFRVPSKSSDYKSRFIVIGDMDSNWVLNTSKQTFDWFTLQITEKEQYDGILYLGDMAYDLENNNCQVGDDFIRNISLFTSHYPFMLTAGNHDTGENDEFIYIRRSFASPRISEYDNYIKYNDFYSFRVGDAYYVQFNPYKIAYGNDQEYFNYTLYQMEQELKRIRQNEDSTWLIVYNHYPFYCSNPDDRFCENHYEKMKSFEDIFIKYHVDLCLAGHQHTYERDEPLAYNKIAASESHTNHTYKNPQAPIYIVEGAAGNDEIMPTEIYPFKFYTKFQAAGDGVGILEIVNKTHLYFEHRMSINNSVVDTLWIIKEDKVVPDDNDDSSDHLWLWIAIGAGALVVGGIILYFVCRRKKNNNKLHEEQ